MDSVAYDNQRQMLQQTIKCDQEELREAVQELAETARVRLRFAERIKESPLPWLVGGLLFGLWLGSQRGGAVPR